MPTLSPNMNLVVPTSGTTPGPDWALEINISLTLVDQHDHSPGKGVQITPAGLNINSDLDFNANFATDVAGMTLTAQVSTPAVFSVYANGVDLYYVDGLGNNIRLTQSGGVAGTPGSIANLVPPASATYVAGSKTFVWQSGASIAANMDAASLIMRNITPNSTFGLTLQPPSGLSSNYAVTLPSLPGSNSFMQLSTLGVISASIPISHGLTADNITVGTQIPVVIAAITSSSSPYTVLAGDGMVSCDTTSGNITVNLYTAVGNQGKRIIIKKTVAANTVTIDPNSTETIDGQSTYTLVGIYDFITIISNGSNWQVVDRDIVQYLNATASLGGGAPGGGAMYYAMGLGLALTEGDWELSGTITWAGSGNFVSGAGVSWCGADGANNNTPPTIISSAVIGGFQGSLSASNGVLNALSIASSSTTSAATTANANYLAIRVSSGGQNVYLVGHQGAAPAPGNGPIVGYITARRLR